MPERLNLVDVQKRLSPDAASTYVAEILAKSSPLMKDAIWMPTNKTDSRTTQVRAGLPTVYKRKLNKGTKISKSTVVQNEEGTTTFMAYAENDILVIDSFGDQRGQAREDEATSFIEALGQAAEKELFYGNADADPLGIYGLANRYNSLSATDPISRNVINAGGNTAADNLSIYFVKWSRNKAGLIYPKHAMSDARGIVDHKDMGIKEAEIGTGDDREIMEVYRDRFRMSFGWCIPDWRSVVRICNVKVSTLKEEAMQRNTAMTQSSLRFYMTQALHRLPAGDGMVRCYMNRSAAQALDMEQMAGISNAGMTLMDVQGEQVTAFRGVPIRIDDNLINTEAVVA